MFDAIAPKYDRLNRIMSFRLDVRWRKRAVRDLALPAGSRVLDLASGTGDLCIDLARARHPPDLDRPELRDALGRSLAEHRALQADILRLPVPDGSVDGVTCGFALRNLADLPTFFGELGAGRAAGWAHRPARREHPAQPGHPHGATTSTSATSSRRSARRCPTVRRTATCRRASPTSRRPTRWWRCSPRPASPPSATASSAVASPNSSSPPGRFPLRRVFSRTAWVQETPDEQEIPD